MCTILAVSPSTLRSLEALTAVWHRLLATTATPTGAAGVPPTRPSIGLSGQICPSWVRLRCSRPTPLGHSEDQPDCRPVPAKVAQYKKRLGPAAASASDGVQNTVIIYKRNPARSLQQLVKRAPDQKDPEQFLDTNLVVTPIKEQAPQRVWSLRSGPPELSINMDHGSYPSGSSCRVTP